jgi:hypothetical protein
MSEFITPQFVLLTAHVFGAIVGAGGALMSDAMFFLAIKDKKINTTEMNFLRLGSKVVWVGIAILILTGIGIVLTKPDYYLSSDKFLAKITIVAIITINGFAFQFSHLPFLEAHTGNTLAHSHAFRVKAPWLLISGVISSVSWISTVILGMAKNITHEYEAIIMFYLVITTLGISLGFIFRKKLT